MNAYHIIGGEIYYRTVGYEYGYRELQVPHHSQIIPRR